MLNNILNIAGASVLSKEQQKSIVGGNGEVCDLECYCSSLTVVIQHAWNTGNHEDGEIALGAWDLHCESTYGNPSQH